MVLGSNSEHILFSVRMAHTHSAGLEGELMGHWVMSTYVLLMA